MDDTTPAVSRFDGLDPQALGQGARILRSEAQFRLDRAREQHEYALQQMQQAHAGLQDAQERLAVAQAFLAQVEAFLDAQPAIPEAEVTRRVRDRLAPPRPAKLATYTAPVRIEGSSGY